MKTKEPSSDSPDEGPASLSPESLDRIAELVVSKLLANNHYGFASKQVVAGSNPVSRWYYPGS